MLLLPLWKKFRQIRSMSTSKGISWSTLENMKKKNCTYYSVFGRNLDIDKDHEPVKRYFLLNTTEL